MEPLTSALRRELKSKAQSLKPVLRLGRQGLTPEFVRSIHEAFAHHPLLKIRLEAFKEERKELGPKLADQTGSHLVTVLGNVVVLFRPPAPSAETQA